MKTKLPTILELTTLVRAIKSDIQDDFRAFDWSEEPSIQLTVACDGRGNWNYQTGDNSFTGEAYGLPHWSVVGVYRDSNVREVARDIKAELAEAIATDE